MKKEYQGAITKTSKIVTANTVTKHIPPSPIIIPLFTF